MVATDQDSEQLKYKYNIILLQLNHEQFPSLAVTCTVL